MSNAITISRAIAAAAVGTALSIGAAQANATVTFPDVLKPNGHERSKAEKLADGAAHPRGTHELHVDKRACRASGVASINRCLADSGWRLMAKQRRPLARRPVYEQPDPTWIDPDTGLRCHNTGIATVCSNY